MTEVKPTMHRRMTEDEYRAAAKAIYAPGHGGSFSDGDINVDGDAIVSSSDTGAYVAAWVWVEAEATPE